MITLDFSLLGIAVGSSPRAHSLQVKVVNMLAHALQAAN